MVLEQVIVWHVPRPFPSLAVGWVWLRETSVIVVLNQVLAFRKDEQDLSLTAFVAGAISMNLRILTT